MLYPEIPLAQSILTIFKAKGIKHIVISPGSRNAPLTIGFASNPDFKCYSVVDERVAGFFAMGMAQQLHEPVALVCTSGSALLNYYPAVAEAYYSQIPLIVLSADRPTNKIDIGDGQTIRQRNVFTNHILYNANLSEEASTENDRLICEAIDTARISSGPVHINAPFEEPLYQTISQLQVTPSITQMPIPVTEDLPSEAQIQLWHQAKKKIVLVGTLSPKAMEQALLDKLAQDPSVVILTENTSNLHHPNIISTIDVLITPFEEEDFRDFQPEILITLGGMVVSKRIKAFFRKYPPKHHWHVDPLRAYDTFGVLKQHFKNNLNNYFNCLYLNNSNTASNYKKNTLEVIAYRSEKHKEYLQSIPYSDLMVYREISQKFPENTQLQISNSAAIRYMQLFRLPSSSEVFCNRGTSGIDGSTSTAIGAACASDTPVIFLGGDIGFFYDSNALWNKHTPDNFKIIVVNNSGGGIFRILPGHQETPVFNTYFETEHQLNARHLAAMYNYQYMQASSEEELQKALDDFFSATQKTILEIFTPPKVNNSILKNYFKHLK